MGHLRPGEALIEVLAERNISVLASRYNIKNKRFLRNPFQETAVHMLVKRSAIDTKSGIGCKKWYKGCLKDKCVWYGLRGVSCKSDSVHGKDGDVNVETFKELVTEYPKIGIYMGFAELHTPKELRKLKMQLRETLNAVRTFLWDEHLVLIDLPVNIDVGLDSKFVSVKKIDEIEQEDNVILLDPNADEGLAPSELMNAKYFLLGGIVDKEVPRPGLTSSIPCKNCLRRRISLRGSTVGVPQIIHKLVYSLLRARFELGGNIEKAIIEMMGSTEKRWRIAKEMIYAYRYGEDPIRRAIEVAKWLGASCKDVLYAAKMSGLKVDANEVQAIYCGSRGFEDGKGEDSNSSGSRIMRGGIQSIRE